MAYCIRLVDLGRRSGIYSLLPRHYLPVIVFSFALAACVGRVV